MISILLVDDHELVSTGIEALLNAVEGLSVIGRANSGEKALALVAQLTPDVILMDINMPGLGGVETCRELLATHNEIKILALSAYDDGSTPAQLIRMGVLGFISKSSPVDTMVTAIRTVATGAHYSPVISSKEKALARLHRETDVFRSLSMREVQVVNLILQGQSIQEMSDSLALNDRTINTYRYRLYKKLNVKNDVELTKLAVKVNYGSSASKLQEITAKAELAQKK